jgi:hypothetical protein
MPRGRKLKRVALHLIPYINIGRVCSAKDTKVYIFFLVMYNTKKVINFLGKVNNKENKLI